MRSARSSPRSGSSTRPASPSAREHRVRRRRGTSTSVTVRRADRRTPEGVRQRAQLRRPELREGRERRDRRAAIALQRDSGNDPVARPRANGVDAEPERRRHGARSAARHVPHPPRAVGDLEERRGRDEGEGDGSVRVALEREPTPIDQHAEAPVAVRAQRHVGPRLAPIALPSSTRKQKRPGKSPSIGLGKAPRRAPRRSRPRGRATPDARPASGLASTLRTRSCGRDGSNPAPRSRWARSAPSADRSPRSCRFARAVRSTSPLPSSSASAARASSAPRAGVRRAGARAPASRRPPRAGRARPGSGPGGCAHPGPRSPPKSSRFRV